MYHVHVSISNDEIYKLNYISFSICLQICKIKPENFFWAIISYYIDAHITSNKPVECSIVIFLGFAYLVFAICVILATAEGTGTFSLTCKNVALIGTSSDHLCDSCF